MDTDYCINILWGNFTDFSIISIKFVSKVTVGYIDKT